jgi:hypothetical protein
MAKKAHVGNMLGCGLSPFPKLEMQHNEKRKRIMLILFEKK